MNSLTIDQCVEQINARLTQEGLPATMNVRLLRHYQQQKSIPAPTQEGRFAKYNDEHIDAVIALRKAQDMGVSSKAYTTISNIEKHADPHATVASLGLNTPSWMANSIVGAVSSASSSPSALDMFSSGLDNARAFSNIKIEPSKSKSVLLASPMPTSSPQLSPDILYGASEQESVSFATQAFSSDTAAFESMEPPVESPKNAAMRALQELSVTQQKTFSASAGLNKSSLSNARTMSTLARVVSSSSMPVSGSSPNTTFSRKLASHEFTEWTLDHDVCVQIPSAALGSLSRGQLQALEAWMAQLPDLK